MCRAWPSSAASSSPANEQPSLRPAERGFFIGEVQSVQIDKKHIGHAFKAFTSVAEAGKLKLFCKAIGEEDPIYQDEAAAKKAGYPKIPVAPTFLQALTNDDPEKGGLLKLINVDIGLILHGEQHY